MLVRNCKLTPADVEVSCLSDILCRSSQGCAGNVKSRIHAFSSVSSQFIQPPGSLPSEVLHLALPPSCRPWLPALAWYLRQNLLTFLHSPKYTDSNSRNHFQVRLPYPSTFGTLFRAHQTVTFLQILPSLFLPMACVHPPAYVSLSSHACLYPLPHLALMAVLSPASTPTTGRPPRLGHLLV